MVTEFVNRPKSTLLITSAKPGKLREGFDPNSLSYLVAEEGFARHPASLHHLLEVASSGVPVLVLGHRRSLSSTSQPIQDQIARKNKQAEQAKPGIVKGTLLTAATGALAIKIRRFLRRQQKLSQTEQVANSSPSVSRRAVLKFLGFSGFLASAGGWVYTAKNTIDFTSSLYDVNKNSTALQAALAHSALFLETSGDLRQVRGSTNIGFLVDYGQGFHELLARKSPSLGQLHRKAASTGFIHELVPLEIYLARGLDLLPKESEKPPSTKSSSREDRQA